MWDLTGEHRLRRLEAMRGDPRRDMGVGERPERVLHPVLLRPSLLPRFIVGGSGLLGACITPGPSRGDDSSSPVPRAPAVGAWPRDRATGGAAARVPAHCREGLDAFHERHHVHQQVRRVIDGGADLLPGAIIGLKKAPRASSTVRPVIMHRSGSV